MLNLSNFRNNYIKQGYRIVGENSAVKVCMWTRKSLLGKGECYKSRFYGINSWRCLQMTPSLFQCTHRCVFCWRQVEATVSMNTTIPPDDPKEVVDGCIKRQGELLSGFKGNPNVDLRKWKEAQNPNNAAISLAGEPTVYGRLGELISEFRKRNFTTFLVTNGTLPEQLENLETEPTQLYISLVAPDEDTYHTICRPQLSNGWARLDRSLELMPSFKCRKVIRLTLVKGLNMKNAAGYAKLVEKTGCDFVECKGYMWVGYSRARLKMENMPLHQDIRAFAEELALKTGYKFVDESEPSRVVLLKNKKRR